MKRLFALCLLALSLGVTSCGSGGGGSDPITGTIHLYVFNDQPGPFVHTVTLVGWRPFRIQGDVPQWTDAVDFSADPVLPGETRFVADLEYEPLGYNVSYESDQGGGELIGYVMLPGDVILTVD